MIWGEDENLKIEKASYLLEGGVTDWNYEKHPQDGVHWVFSRYMYFCLRFSLKFNVEFLILWFFLPWILKFFVWLREEACKRVGVSVLVEGIFYCFWYWRVAGHPYISENTAICKCKVLLGESLSVFIGECDIGNNSDSVPSQETQNEQVYEYRPRAPLCGPRVWAAAPVRPSSFLRSPLPTARGGAQICFPVASPW